MNSSINHCVFMYHIILIGTFTYNYNYVLCISDTIIDSTYNYFHFHIVDSLWCTPYIDEVNRTLSYPCSELDSLWTGASVVMRNLWQLYIETAVEFVYAPVIEFVTRKWRDWKWNSKEMFIGMYVCIIMYDR